MAQAASHIPWEKSNPGDLIFFGVKNHIDHVGIVQKNKPGELWVIHSTTQQGVITEDVLVSPYWKKRILFAIDLVEFLETQASVKS